MDLFLPVKPTVLIVDDTPANLSLLGGLLHEHYTVKAVNHGNKALKVVSREQPDLILLDVMMPDINGYEVCRRLKANVHTRHIPVIFLTSKTDIENEEMGMSLGAVDYITRPINAQVLMSRVKAHLVNASNARTMRVNNEYLEFEVSKRAKELVTLQKVTILALASLAEVRDVETGNHLYRTQSYIQALAHKLQDYPRFSSYLSSTMIDIIVQCAPLHDIGKVGIPDRILLKPGRFEPHEYEIIKTHPTLGYEALLQVQAASDDSVYFLEIARQIVYSHHEKWDGTGYPQGLAGDEIPIPARLMALADVYDALVSPRVYKAAKSHADATAIIISGSGQHFDPDIVAAFVALGDEFQEIAKRFADSVHGLHSKALSLSRAISKAFADERSAPTAK